MNVTEKEQEMRPQLANVQRDREWKSLKIFVTVSIPCSIALHFATLTAMPNFGGQLGNSFDSQQEELMEVRIVEKPLEPQNEPTPDILKVETPQEAIAFVPIANLDILSMIGNPNSLSTAIDSAKGAGNFTPTDTDKSTDSKTPAEAAKDIVKDPNSILSNTAPNSIVVAPNLPNLFIGKGSGSLVPNGLGKNTSGIGWGLTGNRTNTLGNGRSPSSALGKLGIPFGLPTGNLNSTSKTTSPNNSSTQSTSTANPSNNPSSNSKIRCQSCVKPDYPSNARERGLEGEAKVAVDVDANGNVINVRLLNSSGHAELDEAAQRAAWNWKFDPSQSGKQAIPARINFQIENSDYSRRSQERRQLEQRQVEEVPPLQPPSNPTAIAKPTASPEPITKPLPNPPNHEIAKPIPSSEPVSKPLPNVDNTKPPVTEPAPIVQPPTAITSPPPLAVEPPNPESKLGVPAEPSSPTTPLPTTGSRSGQK
ncbi:TonB C-terminal domain-containing protein [Tumidithrix helvetica PCC 7403]|uniref:energy transducer TonB n=1 Tax=Tumidithrix helvetica TaxID=3457545 RepID=UPI003C8800D5